MKSLLPAPCLITCGVRGNGCKVASGLCNFNKSGASEIVYGCTAMLVLLALGSRDQAMAGS